MHEPNFSQRFAIGATSFCAWLTAHFIAILVCATLFAPKGVLYAPIGMGMLFAAAATLQFWAAVGAAVCLGALGGHALRAPFVSNFVAHFIVFFAGLLTFSQIVGAVDVEIVIFYAFGALLSTGLAVVFWRLLKIPIASLGMDCKS